MSSDLRLPPLFIAAAILASSPVSATAAGPKPPSDAAVNPAQQPAFEPSRFIRVVRDAEGKPASLETATVRYASPDADDLAVDLVAVTHVGEPDYFGGLNGQLADYDAVLYELVAPEGAVPRKGADGGMIPALLKSSLELEYQTERIDYTRKNFVHADLTPRQIGEKMRERGQTGLSVAFDVFKSMMAEAGRRAERGDEAADLDGFGLATLLLDPKGKPKLKRAFALELERAEMDEALGETARRMLITDRNEVVAAVLRKQIDAGRRRLAIFYGAGHMPDLERRLIEDFGLERQGVQWREAWDLSDKADRP